MEIILLEKIQKLGEIGSVVKVKPGYARNFLFPNKMALRENKKNAEYYEKIKDEIKKNEEIKLKNAKYLIDKIKDIKIIFKKESDDKDQLYGSISKKEVMEYLQDNDIKIKSDDLLIRKQIRSIGEHKIEINPYENISTEISIFVEKN